MGMHFRRTPSLTVRNIWATLRWLPVYTMVQWGDPAFEARLATIDGNMMFLLLGAYSWEYFQSFDVEYAVIRRRRSFRWLLIPYLLGRLFLLITLVLLAFGEILVPVSCRSAIMSAVVFGNITLATSSANLMIRAWLIWKNSRAVHILLLLITLGHWTILALDIANIRPSGSDGVCVVHLVQSMWSAGVYACTMSYDFLVFALSTWKLSKQPSKSSLEGHLRSQGLLYFAIAAIANVPPTVFTFLGSIHMVSITGCVATTASIIVSCRAVRSLLDLRTSHSTDHTLDEAIKCDVVLSTEISISQPPSTILTNV